LGRGGGYFDELTGRAPGSTRVGVGPAACVVGQLPHEPHDRPVQFLVTEDGMITIGV
jgi:5-formyltetrahydrofolate cyclo-ligase